MTPIRDDLGVASVSEKERQSKKEVGGTFRMKNINVPIGMYRQIQHIAEVEGKTISGTVMSLLRIGIRTWREDGNKGQTSGEE